MSIGRAENIRPMSAPTIRFEDLFIFQIGNELCFRSSRSDEVANPLPDFEIDRRSQVIALARRRRETKSKLTRPRDMKLRSRLGQAWDVKTEHNVGRPSLYAGAISSADEIQDRRRGVQYYNKELGLRYGHNYTYRQAK